MPAEIRLLGRAGRGADRGHGAGADTGVLGQDGDARKIACACRRYGKPSAASAAFATITSSSILAPPAATAPITWPSTTIGKPPGTLVKSSMRTAMLSAFSSGA